MTYRYTEKELNARSARTGKRINYKSKDTLTDQQFDDLKCYYASDYVDTLSVNELKDIVYGNVIDCMRDYTLQDVKNECDNYMRKGYFWDLYHQVLNTNQKKIEDPW